jgi:2-polyprenyl-6-hydroxyphenyl methylase / 3-demethylubiquinone-9 3-methyltransferase
MRPTIEPLWLKPFVRVSKRAAPLTRHLADMQYRGTIWIGRYGPQFSRDEPLTNPAQPTSPSLDAEEVAKFSRLAAQWWDPHGKFAVLHKFNPVRLAYIRDHATARFGRDPHLPRPLKQLRLLDIGCGGGLLAEPMARLGAEVVAIDPSEINISTASVHAEEAGLGIDYRTATAEDLAGSGEKFDIILNMEVIEHVVDPAAFVAVCADMLKPGGIMFIATLNRTLKSFALAIIGAEYVLGWLPRGTHHWEKFITPEELHRFLAAAGLRQIDITGVFYNPLTGAWARSRDHDVNYMVLADKPAS